MRPPARLRHARIVAWALLVVVLPGALRAVAGMPLTEDDPTADPARQGPAFSHPVESLQRGHRAIDGVRIAMIEGIGAAARRDLAASRDVGAEAGAEAGSAPSPSPAAAPLLRLLIARMSAVAADAATHAAIADCYIATAHSYLADHVVHFDTGPLWDWSVDDSLAVSKRFVPAAQAYLRLQLKKAAQQAYHEHHQQQQQQQQPQPSAGVPSEPSEPPGDAGGLTPEAERIVHKYQLRLASRVESWLDQSTGHASLAWARMSDPRHGAANRAPPRAPSQAAEAGADADASTSASAALWSPSAAPSSSSVSSPAIVLARSVSLRTNLAEAALTQVEKAALVTAEKVATMSAKSAFEWAKKTLWMPRPPSYASAWVESAGNLMWAVGSGVGIAGRVLLDGVSNAAKVAPTQVLGAIQRIKGSVSAVTNLAQNMAKTAVDQALGPPPIDPHLIGPYRVWREPLKELHTWISAAIVIGILIAILSGIHLYTLIHSHDPMSRSQTAQVLADLDLRLNDYDPHSDPHNGPIHPHQQRQRTRR
ncbi:hypothetical protein CXG81DRAFT_20876 [Caulochytrium protostelioides]|uniref:Uncharacterized protein n=1 Tax=Caulochytrium protostelioides TaxID=1555241 RepID=A0A4P9WXH7_9FUNG|nr:hypothetical protein CAUPRSCDRAFT_10950 [Caulochytrium protostelioides]RKO98975.1 hypothetical protein CXG81DRAFT_20876 [Caulochytrium protostelioides]|eukprot:RKO98975.1 hypothetical protein CXG81DRAFT_20876 [Caulochytrium protostelioides]